MRETRVNSSLHCEAQNGRNVGEKKGKECRRKRRNGEVQQRTFAFEAQSGVPIRKVPSLISTPIRMGSR